eukprot:9136595-Pyramimonas_sp.AAC.1
MGMTQSTAMDGGSTQPNSQSQHGGCVRARVAVPTRRVRASESPSTARPACDALVTPRVRRSLHRA